MDIKRMLTTLIGLPAVLLIVAYGNQAIISICICIISLLCMYEYFNVIKKVSKPIEWVGYISCALILLTNFYSINTINTLLMFSIPLILLMLFLHIIATDMKYTFKDVSYTSFGIIYIVLFLIYLAFLIKLQNGRFLLGYTLSISWATDIFAYLIGKKWGKHKFSKVSPKKSIEGAIAGIVGATIVAIIYTYLIKRFANIEYSYLIIFITSIALSIISQIGDFAASSIKRFVDTKDYGNLLPGHGGMLDRIDSLLFIAPFAYFIFLYIGG